MYVRMYVSVCRKRRDGQKKKIYKANEKKKRKKVKKQQKIRKSMDKEEKKGKGCPGATRGCCDLDP